MSDLVAYAYVNWGRWVADCPHPHCFNAEHLVDPYSGKFGGLTDRAFHCRDRGGCGMSYPVVWPKNAAEIDGVLKLRPILSTRNWIPGEALVDLVVENLEHGIVPLTKEALEATPDGKVFQIVGDEVDVGPAAIAGDVTRLAIGGR